MEEGAAPSASRPTTLSSDVAHSRQIERLLITMRPPNRTMAGLMSLLGSLVLLPFLAAAAGRPEVTITRLENLPNKMFYFDDTPVSCYPVKASLYESYLTKLARWC